MFKAELFKYSKTRKNQRPINSRMDKLYIHAMNIYSHMYI